jgi:hypothetical protein
MLGLVGCSDSYKSITQYNRNTLAAPGEAVGVLPDGRSVQRWTLKKQGNPSTTHYLYVVDQATTTTSVHGEELTITATKR